MARTTLTLNYLGTANDFCLRITLGYKQFLEHVFHPGESMDVTNVGSSDEFNRSQVLRDLIDAGTFSMTVDPGDDDIIDGDPVFPSDADPATVDVDGSVAEGVSALYSRADHKHGLATSSVVTAKIAANAVTAAKLAQLTSGVGLPVLLMKTITAGAGGSADDVTIYSSNAPFKFRVIDAFLLVTTTGGTTLDVRTATAGAGTKLTGTMATNAAGVARPAGTTPTSSSTVAASGSLYARRGDSGMAGELFIWVMPEA